MSATIESRFEPRLFAQEWQPVCHDAVCFEAADRLPDDGKSAWLGVLLTVASSALSLRMIWWALTAL